MFFSIFNSSGRRYVELDNDRDCHRMCFDVFSYTGIKLEKRVYTILFYCTTPQFVTTTLE